MLNLIATIEILVYLFIAPLIRVALGKKIDEYSFWIATFFLLFFIFGGLVAKARGKIKENVRDVFFIPCEINRKWILIIFWILISISISLNYGLFNRRIGTESAAELFASIPLILLVIFRSLEIAIPFLASLVVLAFYAERKPRFHIVILAFTLAAAIVLLGAASSRSWIGLVFLMILIIIQNKLPKKIFRGLIYNSALIALVVFFGVTALRFSSDDEQTLTEYAMTEILQRIDGLELVSKIIDLHGYQLFGINPSAILNPIISMLPFLDAAIQIKAEALTTVKSVILDIELQSGARDINSFLLLDVYYWGGLLGVAIAAVAVGFFSKLVDLRIGITSGWIYHIFLVSLAINLIILEREVVGIVVSIFRDWIILFFISLVCLSRSGNLYLSTRRVKGFSK